MSVLPRSRHPPHIAQNLGARVVRFPPQTSTRASVVGSESGVRVAGRVGGAVGGGGGAARHAGRGPDHRLEPVCSRLSCACRRMPFAHVRLRTAATPLCTCARWMKCRAQPSATVRAHRKGRSMARPRRPGPACPARVRQAGPLHGNRLRSRPRASAPRWPSMRVHPASAHSRRGSRSRLERHDARKAAI